MGKIQDVKPQYIRYITYLLVDTEKPIQFFKQTGFLHNIKHICLPIATFVRSCYNVPARLFVLVGKELQSHGGTTQEDPTAMAVYETALTPLFKYLGTCYPEKDSKMEAFGDNLTSAGKLLKLRS